MDIRRVCVLAVVTAACVTDLRSGRVKNGIVIIGWAAGFIAALAEPGQKPAALAAFLAGAGIPLAAGFLLFKARLLGAGDTKLFSAVGGITGLQVFWHFAVWSLLFGGVISFLVLLCGDNGRRAAVRLRSFAVRTIQMGKIAPYRDYKEGKGMFHFTVPMLMAAVMYAGGEM